MMSFSIFTYKMAPVMLILGVNVMGLRSPMDLVNKCVVRVASLIAMSKYLTDPS